MSLDSKNYADRLGIEPDLIVQELGWDDDVIEELRDDILETTGEELEDEDFREVVDAIIYWWRDKDGDLADSIMDSMALLSDEGFIWILSPKKGEIGYVDPSEVAEAANIAGLSQTLTENFDGWLARRLDQRKSKK